MIIIFFLFKEDRDGENGRDGFERQIADNMLNCPSHNLTRRHGPFPLILPLKCRILYGEHVTAVVKAPPLLFIRPSLHRCTFSSVFRLESQTWRVI